MNNKKPLIKNNQKGIEKLINIMSNDGLDIEISYSLTSKLLNDGYGTYLVTFTVNMPNHKKHKINLNRLEVQNLAKKKYENKHIKTFFENIEKEGIGDIKNNYRLINLKNRLFEIGKDKNYSHLAIIDFIPPIEKYWFN